jgi:hypothetical protein
MAHPGLTVHPLFTCGSRFSDPALREIGQASHESEERRCDPIDCCPRIGVRASIFGSYLHGYRLIKRLRSSEWFASQIAERRCDPTAPPLSAPPLREIGQAFHEAEDRRCDPICASVCARLKIEGVTPSVVRWATASSRRAACRPLRGLHLGTPFPTRLKPGAICCRRLQRLGCGCAAL